MARFDFLGVVAVMLPLLVASAPDQRSPSGFRSSPEDPSPEEAGALLLVGGGGTPPEVVGLALELAGGPSARVVVVPQASQQEDAGEGAAEMFRAAGALDVVNLSLSDPGDARRALGEADLIWFPGGDQSRLLDALTRSDLVEVVVARHRAGAVIGGTSAGAAVQSERMITGSPEESELRAGNTPHIAGLDLLSHAVVDQHFVQRQRIDRLLTMVLDRPDLVGIGIDEKTAAVVHRGVLTVHGSNNVTVIDARGAKVLETAENAPLAATGLTVHVMRAGMSWPLAAAASIGRRP